MFYRKACVAILVYDITDLESFDALKSWVRELILNVDKSLGKCAGSCLLSVYR